VVLKYWGTTAAVNFTTTKLLVKQADGSCSAWVDLADDLLKVHNITGLTRQNIKTKDIPTNLVGLGFWVYPTNIGQGGVPTVYKFGNHRVFKFNSSNVVYDPSYGKRYSGENPWESASITNFVYDDNGSPMFHSNSPSQQTIFAPYVE